MKYADCNARQKKAYRNIYHASNWLLGGLENTMLDNAEGTEEHENAKATLADHDGLVAELYRMATTDMYEFTPGKIRESFVVLYKQVYP